jgi:hypothetical protein
MKPLPPAPLLNLVVRACTNSAMIGVDSMRLVTIATFHQVAEAHMAKNLLESEGIPVTLADEQSAALQGSLVGPGGVAKLQVPEDQAQRSAEILRRAKGAH